MKKYYITSILICFQIYVIAQTAGSIDSTFGTNGKVTSPFGTASSLAIQQDGKIVAAGWAYASNYDFAVVRYNPDGSPDNNFGVNGEIITSLSGYEDVVRSIILQPDGKIIAIGTYAEFMPCDFALVRYNYDGTIDSTFGTNGIARTNVTSHDLAFSAALQSDGKIIVAGHTGDVSNYDFAVVCFNPSGSLDTSFGNNGKVITSVGNYRDKAYTMALQTDGKIIIAGYTDDIAANSDFALVRYNNNGTIDSTFGLNGFVTTTVGNGTGNSVIRSIAIQPDGKIIAGGRSFGPILGWNFTLVRYNSDGSIDTTFGNNGIAYTDFLHCDDYGFAIAIQPDGKIIAVGRAGYDDGYTSLSYFGVVRYNSNGILDTTFGNGGKVITPVDIRPSDSSYFDVALSVSLQTDNKIVVAGQSLSTNYEFAIVRYYGTDNTSIYGLYNSSNFTVFPNPANANLSVVCDNVIKEGNIEIYNLLGRIVLSESLTNESYKEINIQNISNGIYFVRLNDGEKSYCKRIIVEHK